LRWHANRHSKECSFGGTSLKGGSRPATQATVPLALKGQDRVLRQLLLLHIVMLCVEGFKVSQSTMEIIMMADAPTQTWFALDGYRNAMTYVLQLAVDLQVTVSVDVVE